VKRSNHDKAQMSIIGSYFLIYVLIVGSSDSDMMQLNPMRGFMGHNRGLPGLRGVEHIGFTVPDIEEASRFFIDVIGCEQVYSLGPIKDDISMFPPAAACGNCASFAVGSALTSRYSNMR
jgi:hypothetical protein